MRGFRENDCRAHRQNIDAIAVFTALESAEKKKKSRVDARVTSLRKELDIQRKLNKIFRVGHAPDQLVAVCKKNPDTIIGSCSLYAYEGAVGIWFGDQLFPSAGDFSLFPDSDEPYVSRAKQEGIISETDSYSAIIISTTGRMARMHTITPMAFVKLKIWLAEQADRDKSQRDLDDRQASVVNELIPEYFPQLISEKKDMTTQEIDYKHLLKANEVAPVDDDPQAEDKFKKLMSKYAGKLEFAGYDNSTKKTPAEAESLEEMIASFDPAQHGGEVMVTEPIGAEKIPENPKGSQREMALTPSSGNVFADLGLPDSDVLLAKSDIVIKINAKIEEQSISQAQAAEILGVTQQEVISIQCGKLREFSLEKLCRLFSLLCRGEEPDAKSIGSVHQ